MKKKIIPFYLIAILFLAACSPRAKITSSQSLKDSGKLAEALATINEALDPNQEDASKTLEWPRSWEVRGDIFMAIYQSKDKKVNALSDDPLTEAFNSFNKALELDSQGKLENSLKVKLTLLTNELTNQAVKAFSAEEYTKALKSFEQILDIQEIDMIKKDNPNSVDTVIIFNAGLAAFNGEQYDIAIKHFKEAAKYGYNDARTHNLIAGAYQLKKDTLGALEALQLGFEKYPNDNDMVNSLIQIYLDMNKTDDAMKYLDLAIRQNPKNPTYHFAKGTLLEKLEKLDEAIESYKKSIEADPNFFNAYYNLGAVYYNHGVKQIDVANAVPTSNNAQYEIELEKADDWFKTALPYMEKCNELKPDDRVTLESLKNLYYRLKDMDKYNAILEKLGQN